jgi:hypothetical protein
MRLDDSARFEIVPGFWSKKWIFFGEREWTPPSHRFNGFIGNKMFSREVPEDEYRNILQGQEYIPMVVMSVPERRKIWWAFRAKVYHHSDEERDPEVIKGLIIQKLQRDERSRQRAIEVARSDRLSNERRIT